MAIFQDSGIFPIKDLRHVSLRPSGHLVGLPSWCPLGSLQNRFPPFALDR
jgi:hypothetical protein